MPSSTLQAPRSHCTPAPIAAYVINHDKTYFKQKESTGNSCSIQKKIAKDSVIYSKQVFLTHPFQSSRSRLSGESLNSMGIHSFLPLSAASFHNTLLTLKVAEVEALAWEILASSESEVIPFRKSASCQGTDLLGIRKKWWRDLSRVLAIEDGKT